jgi:hypothetical protein
MDNAGGQLYFVGICNDGRAAATAIVFEFAFAALPARNVAKAAAPVASKFIRAAAKPPQGCGTTAPTTGAAARSWSEIGGVTDAGAGAGVLVMETTTGGAVLPGMTGS